MGRPLLLCANKKSTHELALMRKHCLQQRAHFRYSPRTDQASSTNEGEVVDGRGWEGCCYGDWGYRRKRGSFLTSVTEKEKARLRRDSQHLQRDERAICDCGSTPWLWAQRPAPSDALSIRASERHYSNGIKGSSLPSLSFVSPASTQGHGRILHFSRLSGRKPSTH